MFIVGNFFGKKNNYATAQAEELKRILEEEGVMVYYASEHIGRIPRFIDTLVSLYLKRNRYRIVNIHFYGGLALFLEDAASFLAWLLCKKIIFTLHGGAIPDKVKKHPKWYARVLKRADVITCPSPFLIHRLKHLYRNFKLIRNTIPFHAYRFQKKDFFQPRLIWMRSFHPIYNPEMALEVIKVLRRTYPQVKLCMAGSDLGYFAQIKRRVNEEGLTEHIIFPGYVGLQEKNRLAKTCDIYICTNRIDNTPVSVLEMMALGLPVVSTNVGGIPYMVEDKKEALLVESEDAEGMAKAVQRIVENPVLGRMLAESGRALASQYSEEVVVKDWLELLNELRSGKKVEQCAE